MSCARCWTLALGLGAIVLVVAACGDSASRPTVVLDAPTLYAPKQVYVGQPFVLDASASSLEPGPVRAYVYEAQDQGGFVTAAPRFMMRFPATGLYDVSLQLLGGRAVARTTVEVLGCDRPQLGCGPLPANPCPPDYACVGSVCAPDRTACAAQSDCPYPLHCVGGACVLTGQCPELPDDPYGPIDPPDVFDDLDMADVPSDLPVTDNGVDTAPDLVGDACALHADCATDAFCQRGFCVPSTCDGRCLQRIAHVHAITGLSYVTGIAASGATFGGPDQFALLGQRGDLWLGLRGPQVPPTPAPLPADGIVELTGELGSLEGSAPYRTWVNLDVASLPDAPGGVFFFMATNVDTGASAPPFAAGSSPPRLWGAPAFFDGGQEFPIPDTWDDSGMPLLANTHGDAQPVAYDVRSGALSTGDALEQRLGSYLPDEGAVVCGLAVGPRDLYLLENKVGRNAGGGLTFTATRLVVLGRNGEAPRFVPVPVAPACAIDVTAAGSLVVVGYGSGTQVLVEFGLD